MKGRELEKEVEEIETRMGNVEMGTIEWIRMEERIWELEEMLRSLSGQINKVEKLTPH